MTARNWNWSVGDQVAIRDFVGTPYLLGTITTIRPDGMLYIDLGAPTAPAIRYPDDVRVVPANQVPIDERHWVPASVRDQLVRQEAAGRLRALVEALHPDAYRQTRASLVALALAVGNLLLNEERGNYAAIARALLTPTREEVPDAEPRLVTSP